MFSRITNSMFRIAKKNRSHTLKIHKSLFSTSQKPLFDKILIANRGEIACRVIKTCKKLGIKTVAIYSEPDANSVHVKMADEAICVGPALSAQSYLSIPNIVAACKQTGAQAVHPGYGFLSENKIFQETLQANGIKFIGPNTKAITAMGDKISSKLIAREAKVNTIPGVLAEVDSDADVIKIANQIGYPVMIKASAGGGGKGMRVAYNDKEAIEGFHLSRNEARSSFANDTMFIEKFIEQPHHIEIQIIADAHGNAVYLNERECSVQRRNQKVIEEAPSCFIDPATRKAMGEQAVALAKAVGYESAGTVEFLVDKNKDFYFLEMNTRLQVEHPVTEYITGLDLVELMIYVAAGNKLPLTQSDVKLDGWAIESRVYAEDPLRNFLPSIGKLTKYIEPTGDNIRFDSGIREGNEISIYYDPMISKVITYGKDRNEALQKQREALDMFVIRGVTHNVNFLRSLCDHPRFIAGHLTTNFIPEEYPKGYHGADLADNEIDLLIGSSLLVRAYNIKTQLSISGQLPSFESGTIFSEKLLNTVATFNKKKYNVTLLDMDWSNEFSSLTIDIDGRQMIVSSEYQQGDIVFQVECNERVYTYQVVAANEGSSQVTLQYVGTSFTVDIKTTKEDGLYKYMPEKKVIDTSKLILSPMPGAIFSMNVSVGDKVVPGQDVCIVEAMKMQNILRSQTAGIVKKVCVSKGQTVSSDQVLIEFE